jgi:prolyl-tRNA synthetase
MRVDELLGRVLWDALPRGTDPVLERLVRGGYLRSAGRTVGVLPLGARVIERIQSAFVGEAQRVHDVSLAMLGAEVTSWRQLPLQVWDLQPATPRSPRFPSVLQQHTVRRRCLLDAAQEAPPVLDAFPSIAAQRVEDVDAEQFVVPGRGTRFLACPDCGRRATEPVAAVRIEGGDAGPIGERTSVHTPGAKTVDELAAQLGTTADRIAKSMVLQDDAGLVLAVLRGDRRLSGERLERATGRTLQPADEDALRAAGLVPGFVGPVDVDPSRVTVVVDAQVASGAWICGANAEELHWRDVVHGRDFHGDVVSIARVDPGATCVCGGTLEKAEGAVVAQRRRFTDDRLQVLDADQVARPVHVVEDALYPGVMLAALAAVHGPEALSWPPQWAPCDVMVLALGSRPDFEDYVQAVVADLEHAGLRVLLDDRSKVKANRKFDEGLLRGLPFLLAVRHRDVEQQTVEVRWGGDRMLVARDALLDALTG